MFESRQRAELVAWLTHMRRRGGLLGLPPRRTPLDPVGRRPDGLARDLLDALRSGAPDLTSSMAEARAFRLWVSAQPRRPLWTRRSGINLDAPGFAALHSRREIHRRLEAIAHPDPNGPGFTPPPARSRAERLQDRRRRAARKEPGRTRTLLAAWLIVNASAALLGGILADRGRLPIAATELPPLVLAWVAVVVTGGLVIAVGRFRGSRLSGPPRPAVGPVADAWLDRSVGASKGKDRGKGNGGWDE